MTAQQNPAPMPALEKNAADARSRFLRRAKAAQVRQALKFYKILSYTTGSFLLLLCLEMLFKYGFGLELFLGAKMTDGSVPLLAFARADQIVPYTGTNLSLTVLIVHGWIYVIYLIACFMLWSRMRWNFSRLVMLAFGGVVPLLSFFTEYSVRKNVLAQLAYHSVN